MADDALEIIRILPDVLFRCYKEGGKIYWSFNEGGLAEEFGLTTDEIRGKSLHELFPGGASPELEQHFEDAFAGKSTIFTNQIGDRHFRHFPKPVYDDAGQVKEVIGFIAEVTDLVNMQRELEATNRELDAYVYTVSHDLAQPLTLIKTLADMVQLDPDNAAEHAGELQRTVRRMQSMADALLGLSRARNAELQRTHIDLSEIARELAGGLDARFIIADGLQADGDPGLVSSLLQNLLRNAVVHGGDGVHVEVGQADSDQGPAFFVRDDGPGFPSGDAERIFHPFERGDDHGTGVGLSTVARIVERHGGQVWAESSPGQGACFWFTLGEAAPAGMAEAPAEAAPA